MIKKIIKVAGITALGLMAYDYYLKNKPAPPCAGEADEADKEILCPFLAYAEPSMESREAFVKDMEPYGIPKGLGAIFTAGITLQQKGVSSLFNASAPDIYNLQMVHGISHCDLYGKYMPQVEETARKVEIDGTISLQNLIDIKKWIAQQEQLERIGEASKFETALAFAKSGGNSETLRVKTNDIVTFLKGIQPDGDSPIVVDDLMKIRLAGDWAYCLHARYLG